MIAEVVWRRLEAIDEPIAYANLGLGAVTAIAIALQGWLSAGWSVTAGIGVALLLTLLLFHPITKWIVAVLGTLMATTYCALIGWFLGGLSIFWGSIAGLVGAALAVASYRRFMRAEPSS
jgi:hypothetical protein